MAFLRRQLLLQASLRVKKVRTQGTVLCVDKLCYIHSYRTVLRATTIWIVTLFKHKLTHMESINMMKRILCISLLIVLLTTLIGCEQSYEIYDEKDFVGLTAQEIIDKYGNFDVELTFPDEGYKNGRCGYKVAEGERGYFGDTGAPMYFLISFDENCVAYKCEYERGGWGG